MTFKDAVKLSENIKNFPGIQSVVLFGDIATGKKPSPQSKIDMAIIYSKKDREIIKWIRYLATDKFKLHHLTTDELKDNPKVVDALSGEGILLQGNPVVLSLKEMELKPKMIISYNTTELAQNDRSKLNRALFGGVSTYLQRNVRKRKNYPGLVEKLHAEHIGKGVLLIDKRNASEITNTLNGFKAQYKEIPIWTH
ncbi:MAG: nucleotidyltransferase domain-containing protein [Methanobacterium sp.]|nr:nucleotidyltransferase domain-containing protein [Methanobacterium sp.]